MVAVPTSITFKREIDGVMRDLILSEEFIKDLHFSTDDHLMVMLRVIGTDSKKVHDFFNESENELFNVTVEKSSGEKESGEYILTSMYLDEGPPLSVDIDQEIPMVRAILDLKKK